MIDEQTLKEIKEELLNEEELAGLMGECLEKIEKYIDLKLRSLRYKPKDESEEREKTNKESWRDKEPSKAQIDFVISLKKKLNEPLSKEDIKELYKKTRGEISDYINELKKRAGL